MSHYMHMHDACIEAPDLQVCLLYVVASLNANR